MNWSPSVPGCATAFNRDGSMDPVINSSVTRVDNPPPRRDVHKDAPYKREEIVREEVIREEGVREEIIREAL